MCDFGSPAQPARQVAPASVEYTSIQAAPMAAGVTRQAAPKAGAAVAQITRQKIDGLLFQNKRLFIAIDGRCAAGKTTLAAFLSGIYQCSVIPMDHFFLRKEQRTPGRLSEPGGNVDHERFLAEVLDQLRRGGDFSYRPYDCSQMGFGEAVCLPEKAVNIIEGSYSCHPSLFDFYDLRLFLTIKPEEQFRRILERNGPVRAEDFRNKWIPLEELYFSAFNIEGRCDLCVDCD